MADYKDLLDSETKGYTGLKPSQAFWESKQHGFRETRLHERLTPRPQHVFGRRGYPVLQYISGLIQPGGFTDQIRNALVGQEIMILTDSHRGYPAARYDPRGANPGGNGDRQVIDYQKYTVASDGLSYSLSLPPGRDFQFGFDDRPEIQLLTTDRYVVWEGLGNAPLSNVALSEVPGGAGEPSAHLADFQTWGQFLPEGDVSPTYTRGKLMLQLAEPGLASTRFAPALLAKTGFHMLFRIWHDREFHLKDTDLDWSKSSNPSLIKSVDVSNTSPILVKEYSPAVVDWPENGPDPASIYFPLFPSSSLPGYVPRTLTEVLVQLQNIIPDKNPTFRPRVQASADPAGAAFVAESWFAFEMWF